MEQLSQSSGISVERLEVLAENLKEVNPMLGHRGCRLAITYPEIAEMQVEAILTAAIEVAEEEGFEIVPEIMIPLVCSRNELMNVKETVDKTAERVFEEKGRRIEYMVGTMIEIPRAALRADDIAKAAEFFSFGTNDLTQMSFGFSRDDTTAIIDDYIDRGIWDANPFQTLDQSGVGRLIETAVSLGKKSRPGIKLGICGEHGGDPKSIEFCYRAGLQYVSCSPYRVPVARLAAAQAVIKQEH
jgi:pyruvate,orthophosphate dikinase